MISDKEYVDLTRIRAASQKVFTWFLLFDNVLAFAIL